MKPPNSIKLGLAELNIEEHKNNQYSEELDTIIMKTNYYFIEMDFKKKVLSRKLCKTIKCHSIIRNLN